MGRPVPRAEAAKPATLEEFQSAIRFLLVNEHGMPELVADDLMKIDEAYVQNAFADVSERETLVMEVATELTVRPKKGLTWVRVNDGQLVLDINEPMQGYLNQLVEAGLYGDTAAEVARSMLCRGIEVVLDRAGPSKRRGFN